MTEVLIALAILGIVAIVFLTGIATIIKAVNISDEQAIAENLVRSEIEYIKGAAYQYDTTTYPIDPELIVPGRWTVTVTGVEPVHATDDGIQIITVNASHDDEVILSLQIYKVDR